MMHTSSWGHMDRFNWLDMTLMIVVSLILLLAVIYLVARRLSDSQPSGTDAGNQDHAVEILRERYARGEIDATEYQQARETLDGSRRNRVAESG